MLHNLNKSALAAAILLVALGSAPAMADVKAGVDAWSRGDYSAAVNEWEGPAAAGDADAMFNLGQAYRLGRGVPVDLKRAEDLYSKAAAAGHLRAADTYGLMLFQDGRRGAALPYVQAAARRGDPRAQYLLGIAHFNGDIVERDWVHAYALLTLANSAGLPQAATAIVQMDKEIPLEQRQQGAGLAVQLRNENQAARATELAAAELDMPQSAVAAPETVGAFSNPVTTAPVPTSRVPQPIKTVPLPPSAGAARAAIVEAKRATGTENPAKAGANFALSHDTVAIEAPRTFVSQPVTAVPVATANPAPAGKPVSKPMQKPTPVAASASGGPWRIQLGAFSVAGNAEQLWTRLSKRSELAGAERLLVPAGKVTKLQAGGFPSRSAADAACRSLTQSGQDCLVTQR